MSFSVGTQPEQLPIIQEPTLIINQGTADILLGDSRGVLSSYGARLAPGNSLVYDLSRQRYIAASTGLQSYDILAGASAAIPGAQAIATVLNASGLANAIAASILASGLSGSIATQILTTGVRNIDVPVTSAWGPLDSGQSSGLLDITDAQSLIISWTWTVTNAANLSAWGAIQVSWWNDAARSFLLGTDTYELGGNLNAPGTLGTSEVAFIRTPCKGAFVEVAFLGAPLPGGAGRIHADGIFVKSYRDNPISKYETNAGADRVLKNFTTIGLGAVSLSPFILCAPYDGPLELTANASNVNAAAGAASFIQYGWGSTQWPVSATAGRKAYTQVFFPQAAGAGESFLSSILRASSRRPLWIRFGNSTAAGVDMTVNVVASTLA